MQRGWLVGYLKCRSCGNEFVAFRRSKTYLCPICSTSITLEPLYIGKLLRRLEVLQREAEAKGLHEPTLAEKISNVEKTVEQVRRVVTDRALQVYRIAYGELISGKDSAEVFNRLRISFRMYYECDDHRRSSIVLDTIGMVLLSRGEKTTPVKSVSDLDALWGAKECFLYLDQKKWVALTDLMIGRKAFLENTCETVSEYNLLLRLAYGHLCQAMDLYSELGETKLENNVKREIGTVTRLMERSIDGWSRETAARVQAEAVKMGAESIKVGLSSVGCSIASAGESIGAGLISLSRTVGQLSRTVGQVGADVCNALALASERMRQGMQESGKKIEAGLGDLGTKTALGVAAGLAISSLIGGSAIARLGEMLGQ